MFLKTEFAACVTWGALCWGMLPAPPAMADDQPAKTEAATPVTLSAAEIDGLLKDLNAADFDTRETATKRLIAAGKPVIDAVRRAADTANLEVGTRCLSVLKELRGSSNTETKTAAETALKELAEGNNRSIARRAAEILEPPAAQRDPAGLPRANINIARAIQLAPARGTRMSMRVTNGFTEIDVIDGESKISIKHADGKDIHIRSQEPAAEKGKDPVTKEYKAKDLAELKEKQPEGHKLYERYVTNRIGRVGNIQIQAGGVPIQIAPAQVQIEVVADAGDGTNLKSAIKELEATREQLAKLTERLKELAGKPEVKGEDLKKLLEEVQSATRRLDEVKKSLPK